MNFWARNKKLLIAVGIALVAFLALGPAVIGDWDRPLESPVIVRPWKADYYGTASNTLNGKARALEDQKHKLFDVGSPADSFGRGLAERNDAFREADTSMRRVMVFIPRPPYVADPADEHPELTALTAVSTMRDNVTQYLGRRSVEYAGALKTGLGFDPRNPTPKRERVPLMFHQIQGVEGLCYLAGEAGVMAVRDITAGACDPYTEGPSAKPRLVQITPIKIRLSASLKSLSRFLASLHGRHGVVSDVAGAGPEQTVVLDVGPAQPTERDRVYTVFRAQDTGFAYVATVQGASVEGAAVRARRLKVQGKTYDPQVEIKKGDLVTSGFFSLIDVGISAVAPTEKRGTNKELVEATPGYLDATVYVGLIEFPPEDVSGGEAPPIAPAGGASPGPTAVPNY